jgi:hypothetical protein
LNLVPNYLKNVPATSEAARMVRKIALLLLLAAILQPGRAGSWPWLPTATSSNQTAHHQVAAATLSLPPFPRSYLQLQMKQTEVGIANFFLSPLIANPLIYF